MVSLEPHVVIVDNLPDGMSIDDMVNVYAKYGDIQDANIEVVEEGGVRFNRGYIGFLGIQAAKNAVHHTNGKSIHGHALTLSMAPEGFIIPYDKSGNREAVPHPESQRRAQASEVSEMRDRPESSQSLPQEMQNPSSLQNQASLQTMQQPIQSMQQPLQTTYSQPPQETPRDAPGVISVLPPSVVMTPELVPATCTSVLVRGQADLSARTLGQLLRPCGRVRQIDQIPEGFKVKTESHDTVMNVLDYCRAPITDGKGKQWELVVQPIVEEESAQPAERRESSRNKGRAKKRNDAAGSEWDETPIIPTRRGRNGRRNPDTPGSLGNLGNQQPRVFGSDGNAGRNQRTQRGGRGGRDNGRNTRGNRRNDANETMVITSDLTSWDQTERGTANRGRGGSRGRRSDREPELVMPSAWNDAGNGRGRRRNNGGEEWRREGEGARNWDGPNSDVSWDGRYNNRKERAFEDNRGSARKEPGFFASGRKPVREIQEFHPKDGGDSGLPYQPYQPYQQYQMPYQPYQPYQMPYQPYQPYQQYQMPYQPYQPLLQESENGLLVEDLNVQCNEAMVRSIFRTFGPIQRVQFVDSSVVWGMMRGVRDRAVYFVRTADAMTAKKAMNGQEIEGSKIRISVLVKNGGEADEKPQKQTTL